MAPHEIPVTSYLWELPFHSPSPYTEAKGGHWGKSNIVDYLTCGITQEGELPNPGWFAEVREVCYDKAVEEPDRIFFMTDEPVSSLYYPVIEMEVDIFDQTYTDLKVHGSVHDTAYLWADVVVAERGKSAYSLQSLIVDTGSSLTTFPCQQNCVGGCPPHATHIDPPFPIDDFDHYSVPCSPSCRSCLVPQKGLHDYIMGGEKQKDRYCDSLDGITEASRTSPAEVVKGAKAEEGSFSRNDIYNAVRYPPADLPAYMYPAPSVDYKHHTAHSNMPSDIAIPPPAWMMWNPFTARNRQQPFTPFRYAQHTVPRDQGNPVLEQNLSRIMTPEGGGSERNKLLKEVEFANWLDRTRDVHDGSSSGWLFLHKHNLWRWQKDIGLSFVIMENAPPTPGAPPEDKPICHASKSPKNVAIRSEPPPLLNEGMCGFEVAYMEGSKLRGGFKTADVVLQAADDKSPPIRYPFIHGCTTLETHLFLDQLATGIMGLEPWPYYPVESIMASITRRDIKPKQWNASFHLCYSGQGGAMRLNRPFNELVDRTVKDGKYLLEELYHRDRATAKKDPLFTQSNPLRGEGRDYSHDHYSDPSLPARSLPVALVVRESGKGNVRPSYTLGLKRLSVITETNRVPLLPAGMKTSKFFKKVQVLGLRGLNEKLTAERKENLQSFARDSLGGKDGINTREGISEAKRLMGGEMDWVAVPVIIDSGTTMSHMPLEIYQAVVEAIEASIAEGKKAHGDRRRLQVQEGTTAPEALAVYLPFDDTFDIREQRNEGDASPVDASPVDAPPPKASPLHGPNEKLSSYKLMRDDLDWEDLLAVSEIEHAISTGEGLPTYSAPRRDRFLQADPGIVTGEGLKQHLQTKGFNKGQVCWYMPSGRSDLDLFPVLEMEFVGGVTKRWHPEQYTYGKSEKWRCLALTIGRHAGGGSPAFQMGMSFFTDEDIGFLSWVYPDSVEEFSEGLNQSYREASSFTASLRRSTPQGLSNMGRGNQVVIGVSMQPAICPRRVTRGKVA